MDSAGVLAYLASVSLRSLVLFGVAVIGLAAFRVKAAAARHAVWTVVAGGMLLLAALTPALPPLPMRVLKSAPVETAQLPPVAMAETGPVSSSAPAAPPRAPLIHWQDAAAAAYGIVALILLARLAFGYLFTRRLVRAAAPVDRFDDTYSSSWISVPMTIGRTVVLPADWESWPEAKLQSVLAHERTHVRRADWAIALAAGAIRCVFWFHPLAWWLERRLATLAEQACDDSALLLVESRAYAQALLEMAAAVNTAQGRLIWEAMAMAKTAEIRRRIDLILDETRQIPRAVTRARWLALAACSLPLVWIAAVAQLVPAAAQEGPKTPAAMSEFLRGRRQLTQADVAIMEQYLASNPHDVDVRAQVILYYYSIGVREPRLTHIVWLIDNHPESSAAAFASSGVLPRDNAQNSRADYERVVAAWKRVVGVNQNNAAVLGNAAQFFEAAGELETAAALLTKASEIESGNPNWKSRLGKVYALAILQTTGDPKYPAADAAFAERARAKLLSSEDGNLLFATGSVLANVARRPAAGQPLPPGVLNLDEHPLLQSAVELGQRLVDRAAQYGGPRVVTLPRAPGSTGVIGGIIGSAPSTGPREGVPGGVIGGIVGGVPAAGPPPLPQAVQPAPPIVKRVEPEYPPLARQAQIFGIVKLAATINPDGTVKHLQAISGHPLLVPASVMAVRQWVFQSSPAEVHTILEIPFTLPPGAASAPTQPLEQYGAFGRAGSYQSVIRVGGNVQSAKLLEKVAPIYPPAARAEGIEGNVTLRIRIAEDGQVESAEPVEGSPALAAAAQEAVRQWRYQPTLLNGNPVKVETTVTMSFQLR